MSKTTIFLISSTCLLLACPVAFSETPPTAQPAAGPTMAEQGQVMVQHGEELIRQGQMMKEEGQKWIQQSGKAGASTEAKAPIIQTTTQTTTMPTTPPANPSKPGQLMQNSSQYQEYVKQGQQLWKETKQMIPSSKK